MYKILLCLRYLRTRYIALASIISVMLGVATMIVVNSVMAGFSTEMRDRIHGILADIVIETNNIDGQPDAKAHMELVRKVAGDKIAGMTATVEVYGMLSFQYAGQWITRPITLIGIDPQGKSEVGPLVDYLESYRALREGDEEIRPRLRSRTEAPGWELTKQAHEYRARWAMHQPWNETQEKSGDSPEFTPESDSGDSEPDFVSESVTSTKSESATETQFNDDPFDSSQAEVDPAQPLDCRLYVAKGLISYPFEDKKKGIMRTMMMVQPGNDVKLSSVTAGRPPNPVHFNGTIVDVFHSGMSEYDSSLVFCNLDYLQKVRGMVEPTSGVKSITSIQIKLKDFGDAEEVVQNLRSVFHPSVYTVQTWEHKQGPLLAAIEVESAILNVLLFLIITVAGFGILAIFFMIVVEKTRDIGILKSLGASSGGVMSIFICYGLALGIVGSGVGVILGLLFVHYINEIEKVITWIRGNKVFDERIYYFPEIPTSVHFGMVFWVAFGAMLIAVLASVLPARRAARLHPVEALRSE